MKNFEAIKQKQQDLYGDDEPYDVKLDENFNEKVQLEAVQRKIA